MPDDGVRAHLDGSAVRAQPWRSTSQATGPVALNPSRGPLRPPQASGPHRATLFLNTFFIQRRSEHVRSASRCPEDHPCDGDRAEASTAQRWPSVSRSTAQPRGSGCRCPTGTCGSPTCSSSMVSVLARREGLPRVHGKVNRAVGTGSSVMYKCAACTWRTGKMPA